MFPLVRFVLVRVPFEAHVLIVSRWRSKSMTDDRKARTGVSARRYCAAGAPVDTRASVSCWAGDWLLGGGYSCVGGWVRLLRARLGLRMVGWSSGFGYSVCETAFRRFGGEPLIEPKTRVWMSGHVTLWPYDSIRKNARCHALSPLNTATLLTGGSGCLRPSLTDTYHGCLTLGWP